MTGSPTSAPLLTIGAFARAVGLTPTALRHYDECGLLVPAEVDHTTGYRYYTPDLARRARLIAGMREAGLPIESMRRVLDGAGDDARATVLGLLDERAASASRVESALRRVLEDLDQSAGGRLVAARVHGPTLAAALRQVRVAADADPGSPLSSVLVDVAPEGMDLVATNRYWMAVRTLSVPGSGAGRVALSLPAVAELATALDSTDDIPLELSSDRVAVAQPGGPVVEGRDVAYPAHRMVLAGLEPPRTRAVLPVATLAEAVGRAGRSEVVVTLGDAGVTVGGPGSSTPAYAVGGSVRGEPVRLVLSTALLRRALGTCLGAEALVEVAADAHPVVLRSPYQPGFLALVMPIRQP